MEHRSINEYQSGVIACTSGDVGDAILHLVCQKFPSETAGKELRIVTPDGQPLPLCSVIVFTTTKPKK